MSFNAELKKGLDIILEDRNDLSDYVSKVTFDEERIPIVREELSPDQQKVFDHLINFIKNDGDHQFYSLTGYAGTGKTFLLSRLVSCISSRVALTAPTNKVVKVLQDSGRLSVGKTTCATIHKLLALRVVWKPPSKKGGMPRQVLQRNTFTESTINEYSLVIVDESSMINWEIFSLLYQELGVNLKVIFSGDPAQIPPINESDSVPLSPDKQKKYGFTTGHLNKIMRQAEGNAILSVASAIRDNRFLNEDLIRKYRKLVTSQVDYFPVTMQVQFRDILLEYFDSKEFNADPNYCKVIAWTNNTVNYYNDIIRMRLFKTTNLDKVMKGEQMIADSPVFNENGEIIFNTSDEFEIVDYEMKTFGYSLPGELNQGELQFKGEEKGKFQLNYYRCNVKYFATAQEKANGDANYKRVDILHEKDELIFAKIVKSLAQIGKQSGSWRHYYSIQERFAKIKYNYAITAHKCLPLNSKLLTERGIIKIKDLEDEVISNKGKSQKILSKSDIILKPKYIIETQSGRRFISSPEHRYLLSTNIYKCASEIRAEDYICLWRNQKKHIYHPDLNYYTYGYLVGDGHYKYDSNRVDITILPDSNVYPFLKRTLGKFGATVHEYKYNRSTVQLSVEDKKFRDELSEVGLRRVKGQNKSSIFFRNLNDKANFLRGLMDSDGSCSKDRAVIRFVNISEDLIDETAMLLQEFGIITRKDLITNTNIRTHSQAFVLTISGRDCLLFREQIGFGINYKRERLSTVCRKIKGKSSIDYIPMPEIKETIIQLLHNNKSQGGCSTGGQGLYANGNRAYGQMLGHKNFSYFHLESLVIHLQNRDIEIPQNILNILKDKYFYDRVVKSWVTEDYVEMMDIEVAEDNAFIYNGAIVHNSQGSTYKHVFLIEDDIDENPRYIERNRIKYTSVTRPSETLKILSRKNHG